MNEELNDELQIEKKKAGRPKKIIKTDHERDGHKDVSHRQALINPDEFLILNQDPNRAYRFLSKRMLDKNGGLDRRGWEILTSSNNKGEKIGTHWGTSSSGTDYRNGDLVVGFMPMERFERRKEMVLRRQNIFHESLNRLRKTAHSLGMQHNLNVSIQRMGRSEFEVNEGTLEE